MGEGAAAVGEEDAEVGEAVEDAAEHHAAEGAAGFSGHSDEPREPVFSHGVLSHHLPRVDEEAGTEILRGFVEGIKDGVIEVTVEDMGGDLKAGHTEFADASGHLFDGEGDILHRDGAESNKAFGVGALDVGEVIVEEARPIEGVLGLCPVVEENGDGAKHHDIDAPLIHIAEDGFGRPAIFLDLAKEETIIAHHARSTGLMVIEVDKTAVSVAFFEIRPSFGEDMRVDIDLHSYASSAFLGGSMIEPQTSQVRRSRSP